MKLNEESPLSRETHLWHKAGEEGPETPWAGYKSLGVSIASVGMGRGECDKSNPASESPQENLKPEQQNLAAPPAEPQGGGAQLAPQVPAHHGSSPVTRDKPLSFGPRRESPGEKLHTHCPAGYWCLGVSADSYWDWQQTHLSGNILPHMRLEEGHKILDLGSIKLTKSCCQTDVLECPKQEYIFVGSAADDKRISETKGTIWRFTHPLLSQHSPLWKRKFLSGKIHYKIHAQYKDFNSGCIL